MTFHFANIKFNDQQVKLISADLGSEENSLVTDLLAEYRDVAISVTPHFIYFRISIAFPAIFLIIWNIFHIFFSFSRWQFDTKIEYLK